MRFVTIIEDDPITGVKYGPVEIPFSNVPKHEVIRRIKNIQAIKAKQIRTEKQKNK